jgi:hypothetical protein
METRGRCCRGWPARSSFPESINRPRDARRGSRTDRSKWRHGLPARRGKMAKPQRQRTRA